MKRTRKIVTVGVLAVGLFVIAGLGAFHTLVGDAPAAIDPAAGGAPALAIGGGNLDTAISNLQQRLKVVPSDWKSLASLGLAYVQKGRVTADPTYYPKAEGVLAESVKLQPQANAVAMVGLAALASARHDFTTALSYGEQAKAVNPYSANVYGVIGDAQVELGRYPEAFRTFQRMVNTKPGLSSYARVSYARELQGDVAGALAAMRIARDVAGSPSDVAWASYQIGDLFFNSGKLRAAERAYRYGSQADPTYVPNLQGEGKVAWARGDITTAIARYGEVVQRYPSPEYVTAYGDLLSFAGKAANAEQQYSLVRAEAQIFQANGVNTNLELALFDADHGDPAGALRAASEEWARRHSIHVADAYAWALQANGRYAEAARYSRKALALGTRNALFEFHAGMIQLALGHRAAARTYLREAIATNPNFSIMYSPVARRTLAGLEGAK